MNPIYVCSNCGWKVTLGMDFGMDDLSPCSVCNSIMEGIKIIEKDTK
jgi:transcription initiation factor IIE alpha subunit